MVKVKTSYKNLREIISELSVVYKSKNIVDKDKTMVFDLTGDELVLYAFSTGASARRVVEAGVIEVIEEGLYNPDHFQLPLVTLENFLNAYSGGRGVPLDVEIEVESEHSLSVVLTEELEINGKKEVNTSVARLSTYPVMPKMLRNVDLLNAVDGLEVRVLTEKQRTEMLTMVTDLQPYLLESLNDVVKNKVAVSFYGDYTMCNDMIMALRYDNKFRGVFDNGGLSVHAIGVIEGLLKLEDDITYVLDVVNKVLVFKTSKLLISVVISLEARVYQRDFFAMVEDNNYIVVPRVDVNEVITRMSILERVVDTAKMVIVADVDNKVGTFSTDSYAQPIHLVDVKSMEVVGIEQGLKDFPIQVGLTHLKRLLLGKTGVHSDNVRFTIQSNPSAQGKYFFRADDESGNWAILIMISS